MKITRIIAMALIAGGLGLPALQAQTLQKAQPPAEFPPASFKGKQYVDSKGCIYIRAGIDGNVTWVPRVNRSRKQICGYQQTKLKPGASTSATSQAKAPELITVPAAGRPTATAARTPVAAPAPKTTVKTTAKPTTTTRTTTQATVRQPVVTSTRKPVPTVASTLPAAPKPAPVKTKPAAVVAAPTPAAPAARAGGCSNASSLSQRYINKTPDVRCGPQAEAPVTFGSGSGIGPQSSLRLTPNTRVVQRHIYDNRQNTQNFKVPAGYRSVWSDDRLNPQRAERGLRPAVITQAVRIPEGYRRVEREDDRMNPMRGVRTAAGDAQSAQIWTNTLPKTLKPVPTQAQIITLPTSTARSPAEATHVRVSTRSASQAQSLPRVSTNRYIRVATYETDAVARETAQNLAGTGLPMRLGSLNKGGKSYRVVLAGPYSSDSVAERDLARVRAAGFGSARLSK
ncbi:SPOR domain-containing protein [Rhodobacteraceae bacterium M382]|nr:SPOR domain-containing protein [Rhodobacteraceae bacterium M382]